jgi:hypothetical protein
VRAPAGPHTHCECCRANWTHSQALEGTVSAMGITFTSAAQFIGLSTVAAGLFPQEPPHWYAEPRLRVA